MNVNMPEECCRFTLDDLREFAAINDSAIGRLAVREIERLRGILSRIEAVPGCECDSYEGHRCVLCRVREIAREGRAE